MQKGKPTVGDHVKNLLATAADEKPAGATTPRKMWDALMTKPMPCQLPPSGWNCTRPAGHAGPCAAVPEGKDGPGIPFGGPPLESPVATVARAAFSHGFDAGKKNAGPPQQPLELPPAEAPEPLELPTPADEDDGAVLAVRLPIDLGAMGKLAGVMASIHGTVPLQVDTVGGWAVFKINKGGKQ